MGPWSNLTLRQELFASYVREATVNEHVSFCPSAAVRRYHWTSLPTLDHAATKPIEVELHAYLYLPSSLSFSEYTHVIFWKSSCKALSHSHQIAECPKILRSHQSKSRNSCLQDCHIRTLLTFAVTCPWP